MSAATGERPAATLPLPNALAYAIAAVGVGAMLVLPFALAARGLDFGEMITGYYLHSFVLFAVLGALILRQRPGHVIGWLLVAIGGFDVITKLRDIYDLFGLADRPGFPSVDDLDSVIGWVVVASVAGMSIALPQLFPDGRVLSPRWRPLAWFGAAATVFVVTMLLTVYVVLGSNEGLDWLLTLGFAVFGLAMVSSLVPLVVRYRRSRGIERQQLKWVFFGLAVSVPLVALDLSQVFAEVASGALSLPALVIIPGTITVAVLRYRLYDIDVVINKTVVFVVLAAFITAVYAAIVVGLGRLLPVGQDNLGLAIAATALVAVAFEPVRVRVQHWANRLVYGRRATPYEALAAMTATVGESADPGAALAEAARLLAEGTGAAQAVVWVAQDGVLDPRASAGDGAAQRAPVPLRGGELPALSGTDLAQAVRHQGQLVGALTLAKRAGEGVSTADRRLVEELAGQAALLLANTRLRSRLTDRFTELRASRRRMLAAQDRARHALERDLHDGAQQELVALKIKLGLARTIATREGATDLAAQLADTATVADQAVDTLREVARGIYPPLLESDGLAAALTAQTRRTDLAVTVLARGTTRYPRDLESTAFFCAVEAVHNAARHANAEHAHIQLDGTDTTLTVTITDDGHGFDPDTTTPGAGLTHMTDRADAAGGTITITSAPGHGTTITLTLTSPSPSPSPCPCTPTPSPSPNPPPADPANRFARELRSAHGPWSVRGPEPAREVHLRTPEGPPQPGCDDVEPVELVPDPANDSQGLVADQILTPLLLEDGIARFLAGA